MKWKPNNTTIKLSQSRLNHLTIGPIEPQFYYIIVNQTWIERPRITAIIINRLNETGNVQQNLAISNYHHARLE